MTLYRVETKKQWGAASWVNRYYVNAASQAAAATAGLALLEIERQHTSNLVSFIGARVSTAAADGRTGRTYLSTGTVLGAFNFNFNPPIEIAARVLFEPGPQQPGVKYYHFCVDMNAQQAGALLTAAQTIMDDYAADLLASGFCADALGGLYTDIKADKRLHIHQMYRAWAAREGVDQGD